MRYSVLTTFVVLALSFTNAVVVRREDPASSETYDPELVEADLAQTAYDNLSTYLEELESSSTVEKRTTRCTLGNVSIRREWGALSKKEREAYTCAVLCLQGKPSKSDPALVPGARSRYDDFVATHINQTMSIHGTANFLSWHRYYVWSFEQALRNECGYTGAQPYWNWGKYSDNPESSPVFDGSAYSLSGNGAYVAGRNSSLIGGGAIPIPPGNGGGCLTNGPFKDMVVNLGPLAPTIAGINKNPQANGFGYNPRCVKRDIGNYISRKWGRTVDITELILLHSDIGSFQARMQGDFPNGFLGVHSAGHFTIGGDPGGDFFTSPGDPAFWVHHGMIDRVWWIWQNLDCKNRIETIAGTITINNNPPSRNGTLDDTINLGVIAPTDIKLRELMSTVDGPFCYIYL